MTVQNILKQNLLNKLSEVFDLSLTVDNHKLTLLNKGNFGNADVYRFEFPDKDLCLTVKDFSHCSWFIRQTFAKALAKRECNFLNLLQDIPGIVGKATMLSSVSFCFPFIKGQDLSSRNQAGIKTPESFFIEFEQMVRSIHTRRVVHLDVRNLGNVICSEDGKPYLIDFQSAFSTKIMFPPLRRLLEKSDLSGVYKCWKGACSTPLPEEQAEFLRRFNKVRKLWLLKGHPIKDFKRKMAKRKQNK